jgi:hypothetical protein
LISTTVNSGFIVSVNVLLIFVVHRVSRKVKLEGLEPLK